MTVEVKREIINSLLNRNILVNKDTLLHLNGVDDILLFKDLFEQRLKQEDITHESFMELLDMYSSGRMGARSKFGDVAPGTVDVVFSYEQEPKKREVRDFVDFFTARYNALRQMLQNRTELKNITSINRLRQRSDREEVSVIGLISDKQTTHTGKIVMTLEDPTGLIKVMISPDKDLFALAKDCMLDEVIGICGSVGDNIIFANNLILPDVPLCKELKKTPDEAYAIFIGDLHFGLNVFLTEAFDKFLSWLSGEGDERYLDTIKKIKYMFIVGDLVEGVGIYPGQDADLTIKDIYAQYDALAEKLKKVPQHIKIVICPGNHDAMRIAEPQPPLYKDFAASLWKLPNVIMVSNPAFLNIHKHDGFPGLDVLLYHGFSFPYYADAVESIRNAGGHTRVDLIMEFLLKRRHLAPAHTCNQALADPKRDSLVIDKIPDIFATGHIHRVSVSSYRNVTLLNCSTWATETPYQEKVGLKPQPGRALLVNLQTRKVKIMKFYDEEKEKTQKQEDAVASDVQAAPSKGVV